MLGLSPWDSPRSMWHKMRGDIPWDEESEAMERGNLLESGVLAWWRKHHEHERFTEQLTTTLDDWCVATPDAVTIQSGESVIVEAKTAARDDDWGTPGTDQVPTYYLCQAYFAAHVLNLAGTPVKRVHMPVLFGTRLRFENYVIEYDAAVGAELLARCRDFYDSLVGDPPPLDDTVATYEVIRKIHPDIARGESVELDAREARRLVEWTDELESTKRNQREAMTTVAERMGRAQYATHNGVRIARRQARGDSPPYVVVLAKPADLTELENAS